MGKRIIMMLITAIFGTLLMLIILGMLTGSFNGASELIDNYAIVFECGSNVVMYVYKWRNPKRIDINTHHVCRLDGNLLKPVLRRNDIDSYFLDCINQAKENIPKNMWKQAYIGLIATDETKLFENKNNAEKSSIIHYIRYLFAKTEFLYVNNNQVRLITKQEEGVYEWISTNYLLNNFKPHTNFGTTAVLRIEKSLVQVVFAYPKKVSTYFAEFEMYGIKHHLFSESFPCWSTNQFISLYLLYVISRNTHRNTPACFPKNFLIKERIITEPSCLHYLPSKDTSADFSFPFYKSVHINNYYFEGTSNIDRCINDVSTLLASEKCLFGLCQYDKIKTPSMKIHNFYIMSLRFDTLAKTKKLLKLARNDYISFSNATKILCSKTFIDLKYLNTQNNAEIEDSDLATLCFSNVYLFKILEHFGLESFERISISDEFQSERALGYLINTLSQNNFFKHQMHLPILTITSFIILGALIMIILIQTIKLQPTTLTDHDADDTPIARSRCNSDSSLYSDNSLHLR